MSHTIKMNLQRTSHSILTSKRENYRKQIRRRDLEQYFSKIRKQLIASQQQNMLSPFEDAINFIRADNLSIYCYPLRMMLAVCPSGELFQMLTNCSINKDSILMEIVMREKIQVQIKGDQSKIIQIIENDQTIRIPEHHFNCLKDISVHFQHWQIQKREEISQIVKLINHPDKLGQFVSQEMCIWVGFLSNFLLVNLKIKKIIAFHQKKDNHFYLCLEEMSKEKEIIKSCSNFFVNATALEDYIVLQMVGPIVEMIGCHIDLIEGYHNILLVKGTSKALKDQIISNYLTALQNNQEEFLDKHELYTRILTYAIDYESQPGDKFHFTQHKTNCLRLISLIDRLLRIVNFRYQNDYDYHEKHASEEGSHDSILYICKLIRECTASQDIGRQIVSSKYILRMFLNNLRIRSKTVLSQITLEVMNSLGNLSRHQTLFLNLLQKEPQFWNLMILMLKKCADESESKIQAYSGVNKHHNGILQMLIHCFSNVSGLPQFQNRFITDLIYERVVIIHNKHSMLAQNRSIARKINNECQYVFVNQMAFLKKQAAFEKEYFLSIVVYWLKIEGIVDFFISMLKLTAQKAHIVQKMVQFISILCDFTYSFKFNSNELIQNLRILICNPMLTECFTNLIDHADNSLSLRAEYGLKGIRHLTADLYQNQRGTGHYYFQGDEGQNA